MIQDEQATEFARRVHAQALAKRRREERAAHPNPTVEPDEIVAHVRSMVRRYRNDGFKWTLTQWTWLMRAFGWEK